MKRNGDRTQSKLTKAGTSWYPNYSELKKWGKEEKQY
jgi:hypothetical protein